MSAQWLDWALQIQAIAQTGLHYGKDPYDLERYERLRAIALEMLAHYTDAEPEFLRGLFARESGYATPKVDVRGVILRDSAVLLTRERGLDRWALPGGFADVGESAGEAVAREVREETGFEVRPYRLLALYDWQKHRGDPVPFSSYKAFFACELVGGAPATDRETEGVGFFGEDHLPPLDHRGRTTPDQLRRVLHLYRHPELGAEFD